MGDTKGTDTEAIIDQKGFIRVGDKAIWLLGGQVDYWLHPASSWPRILDSMRSMDLQMVSCYVPWNFHRVGTGEYDLQGRTDPQKNLSRFLDAATEREFWIFIKPGPWIYDHYMNGGVPLDMSRFHRLHSSFLEGAAEFLRAACEVIVPHQVTRGGRILLCQPDNEIDPLPTFRGRSGGFLPEDKDSVGATYYSQLFDSPANEPFSFSWWLQNVYGEGLDLSAPSGGTAKELEKTPLNRFEFGRNRALRHAVLAYLEWYTTEYTRRISKMLRENGIDVPLALNTFPDMEPQNPSLLSGVVDVVGGDYWGANLLPKSKVLRISRHIRQLRTASPIAWAPEYQSITAGELVEIEGVVKPKNARYLTILGMLCGLKGWNWYTIAERSVLYFAPINNYGGPVKDYYESFRQTHRVFQKLEWPTWQNASDLYLFFSRRQSWDEIKYEAYLDVPVYTHSESDGGIWMDCFSMLHELDYDVGLIDPSGSYNPSVHEDIVLFAGSSAVPIDEQQFLLDLARSGATVLFLSPPPTLNQALEPSEVFSELPGPARVVAGGHALAVEMGERIVKMQSTSVSLFETGPEVRPVLRCEYGTCGVEMSIGDGRVVCVGVDLDRDIVSMLLDYLECTPQAQANAEDVYTSVWRRESGYVVVVLNVGEQPYRGVISLSESLSFPRGKVRVEELFSGIYYELDLSESGALTVDIEGKSGEVYWIK